MKPLIKSHNALIYQSDLEKALRELGIKSSDIVCVHAQLIKLGHVLMPKNEFLQSIIDCFFTVIGKEGTLIMPSFSYSFNQDYDKALSRSTMGILSEYFRLMGGGY